MEVVVLGAGVMGSALTIPLAENGNRVKLWGTEFDRRILEEIARTGIHPRLKVEIPKEVELFSPEEIGEAVKGSEIVVIGVLSAGVRSIARRIIPYLEEGAVVITIAKGLEDFEGKIYTMLEVVKSELPEEKRDSISLLAIAGPSLALELAKKVPTSVVFASKDLKAAKKCKEAFETDYYRPILSDDVVGVEICSVLKNVYAISIGMCEGMKGQLDVETIDNTRGLLFTQAVKEMSKIAEALGGKSESAYGLAGIGDLETTARGGRNVMFGELLGSGLTVEEALEEMRRRGKGTVEGYGTLPSAYKLVLNLEREGKLQIAKDVPLLKELYLILKENKPFTKEVLQELVLNLTSD